MGQCIRGKMADIGLFPKPAAPAVAEAPAPVAAAPAATEEQLTPPALDVTPPTEAPVPENLVAATFGLLRAEPDGSVVIAGSGTPGSEIEVYSDDTLVGSATVESSGDWVVVPEQPLPPGGVEITLAERGKEGRAAQSFVVVVNEDKASQPLVVASAPGQASEILQGLDRGAASATPQVASAGQPVPAAVPAAPVAVAQAPATSEAPTTPAEPSAPPAAPPAAATATTEAASPPAAETQAVASATPAAPETPAAPPPSPAVPPTPAAPASSPAAPPASAPAEPVAVATATASEPVAPATSSVAPAAPAPAATTTQLAAVPPTIDAIEIENGRTFFAGSGPDGGVIRLYVDDVFVADATIEGERWLVEGGDVLDAPSQRVRADLLAPGSSEVVARAEVDFVVDMPAVEPPTAVASADAQQPATAPATPAPMPATAEPAPAVETPAPSATAQQAPVQQAAPAQPAAPASQPAQSAAPEPAVAQAPAPQPAAEPAVPTMVAVSVGGPDAQRFASGKAIIRRGDNLWTIARRVYGEGVKYTTIYEANAGQIRDPDRIYPGQVFSLPQ